METSLESLQRRMKMVERRLGFSDEKSRDFNRELQDLNEKLETMLEKRSAFDKVTVELTEIHHTLDENELEMDSLSYDVKLKLVECNENNVQNRIAQLEQVKSMEKVLDSEHIRGVSDLESKLAKIISIQTDQLKNASDFHSEVDELVQIYNELINDISRQFTFWNTLLSTVEAKNR